MKIYTAASHSIFYDQFKCYSFKYYYFDGKMVHKDSILTTSILNRQALTFI